MAHIQERRQEREDGTLGPKTYRVRYRDPSGRERSRSFKKKSDAVKFKSTSEADLVRGDWHDPRIGRITFGDWVKEYTANADKRPTTAARDKTVLDKHFLPTLRDVPLRAIEPSDIQRLVDQMAKSLSSATVRTNYAVVRAVLSAAVESEKLVRSPCRGIRGIKSPSSTRKHREYLTADDVVRLASAMPKEYTLMVYLGALGLRWSEVVGLRVRNIDFLRRKLTVTETVAEVNGRLQPADVKTDESRRRFSIPDFMVELLGRHLKEAGRKKRDDYVFEAPDGGPVRYTNFRSRVWQPAVVKAEIEGITFHGLRHSAGGLMRQAGVHTQVIRQRLGHASSRTTTDIYGWVPDETDEEAADAIGGLFAASETENEESA